MTNIAQEDRDAAARWYHVDTWLYRLLTEAFARHRIAAEAKERERIVAWLRERGDCWSTDDEIADIIERGEHMEVSDATGE